jgi:hypothetical protein
MTEYGKIPPIFVLILPGNNILPIILSGVSLDIGQYSEVAMAAAKDTNSDALMLVCEQYMVSKPKDSPEADSLISGQIRPSEHPDKEDCLTLVYMDSKGNCDSLIAKVHTDPSGTRYTTDSRWIENSVMSILKPWK